MALSSGDFNIPTQSLEAIASQVQDNSVLAALSPERPSLYGDVSTVRMSREPRAQVVGENQQKSSDTPEWTSVVASPIKFQTTVRMSDEVKWADEDHRLMIVDDLVTALGRSMARAVDLIGVHGINPISGTRAESVTSFLNQTENRAVAGGAPSDEIEAAVGVVMGSSAVASGLALDSGYAFQLATDKYDDGRERNPGLGFGNAISNYRGLSVSSSTTVSGRPEASDTNLRALVGDYSQVRWGFQRRIPVEVIEYGDPDNDGDLKGQNQLAYRAEGVIYVAIFSLDAFAAVDASSGGDEG